MSKKSIEELQAILLEKNQFRFCPICGTPFVPQNSRQKSCGAPDCKRLMHAEYMRFYREKQKAENPEAWKERRRRVQRRYREKKRKRVERDEQLKDLQSRWKKQEEFEKKIAEYGDRYGEVQAAKILQSVPKIDVRMVRKHDNIHDKDDGEGSE